MDTRKTTQYHLPVEHCVAGEIPLELGHGERQDKTRQDKTFITTWCVLLSCVSCWVERHTAREVYVVWEIRQIFSRAGASEAALRSRETRDTGSPGLCQQPLLW